MSIGLFPFIVLVFFGALVALAGVAVVLIVGSLLRKSREAGYPSLPAYLRAAPQTDEEKRDAADLALKGLVLCVLGLLFPPVLLLGLVPFFYGARKVLYASMGLGLADDSNLQDR